MIKKWKLAVMAAAVGAMLLGGCGKKEKTEEEPTVTEEAAETPSPEAAAETPVAAVEETDPVPAAEPVNMNLLTGQGTLSEYSIGKRPVAVMINNVTPAMPQSGVSGADVIFEVPVEGDLTRLMALYGDMTEIPKVCSVRSCRYYFPILAVGFDAFYAHWGMDDTIARETLASMEINSMDGMDNAYNLFGRDQERLDRGVSSEHTAYFDGPRFTQEIGAARVDLKEDKKGPAFSFVENGSIVQPQGNACNSVKLNFGASSTTMTYDSGSNTYLMSHNDAPQLDADTGAQVAVTNVLVLETAISVRDDVGRKNVDWQGGDNTVSYYISNGAVQQIRWSKSDMYDYLKFTDMNGQELKINRGKTYIAMNYPGQETFS